MQVTQKTKATRNVSVHSLQGFADIYITNTFKHSEQDYNTELHSYKIKFLLVCFSTSLIQLHRNKIDQKQPKTLHFSFLSSAMQSINSHKTTTTNGIITEFEHNCGHFPSYFFFCGI